MGVICLYILISWGFFPIGNQTLENSYFQFIPYEFSDLLSWNELHWLSCKESWKFATFISLSYNLILTLGLAWCLGKWKSWWGRWLLFTWSSTARDVRTVLEEIPDTTETSWRVGINGKAHKLKDTNENIQIGLQYSRIRNQPLICLWEPLRLYLEEKLSFRRNSFPPVHFQEAHFYLGHHCCPKPSLFGYSERTVSPVRSHLGF